MPAIINLTHLHTQAISEGITDVAEYVGKRPTWRQSETYASLTRFKQESGYKYSYSCMLDEIGKLIEVKYGTKDSIRPDFYNEYTKHCVDIKNYTITTPEGRSKLVSNVISQYNERKSILPPDVKYEVVIDVRGQSWEQSHLDDITRRIKEQSNDKITVSYFK